MVERNRRKRLYKRRFIYLYKKLFGKCVDCGEDDHRVLDFDHVLPETKEASISGMVATDRCFDKIKAEMAKCVIRCANCHRIRTYEDRLLTQGKQAAKVSSPQTKKGTAQ